MPTLWSTKATDVWFQRRRAPVKVWNSRRYRLDAGSTSSFFSNLIKTSKVSWSQSNTCWCHRQWVVSKHSRSQSCRKIRLQRSRRTRPQCQRRIRSEREVNKTKSGPNMKQRSPSQPSLAQNRCSPASRTTGQIWNFKARAACLAPALWSPNRPLVASINLRSKSKSSQSLHSITFIKMWSLTWYPRK